MYNLERELYLYITFPEHTNKVVYVCIGWICPRSDL